MTLVPLTLREANGLVGRWHRHHQPVRGCQFALGARAGETLVGAVIVGRPVARGVDWRQTCEVTRLVTDGTTNACSFLYGATQRCGNLCGRGG